MSPRGLLALGLAAGSVAAAVLTPQAERALDRLAAARTARAIAESQAARPAETGEIPLAADVGTLKAGSRDQADALLGRRIRDLARRQGVLVETLAIDADMPHLARIRFSASGNEKAVLALVDALERERPMVVLTRWAFRGLDGGSVRIEASAAAPWK